MTPVYDKQSGEWGSFDDKGGFNSWGKAVTDSQTGTRGFYKNGNFSPAQSTFDMSQPGAKEDKAAFDKVWDPKNVLYGEEAKTLEAAKKSEAANQPGYLQRTAQNVGRQVSEPIGNFIKDPGFATAPGMIGETASLGLMPVKTIGGHILGGALQEGADTALGPNSKTGQVLNFVGNVAGGGYTGGRQLERGVIAPGAAREFVVQKAQRGMENILSTNPTHYDDLYAQADKIKPNITSNLVHDAYQRMSPAFSDSLMSGTGRKRGFENQALEHIINRGDSTLPKGGMESTWEEAKAANDYLKKKIASASSGQNPQRALADELTKLKQSLNAEMVTQNPKLGEAQKAFRETAPARAASDLLRTEDRNPTRTFINNVTKQTNGDNDFTRLAGEGSQGRGGLGPEAKQMKGIMKEAGASPRDNALGFGMRFTGGGLGGAAAAALAGGSLFAGGLAGGAAEIGRRMLVERLGQTDAGQALLNHAITSGLIKDPRWWEATAIQQGLVETGKNRPNGNNQIQSNR